MWNPDRPSSAGAAVSPPSAPTHEGERHQPAERGTACRVSPQPGVPVAARVSDQRDDSHHSDDRHHDGGQRDVDDQPEHSEQRHQQQQDHGQGRAHRPGPQHAAEDTHATTSALSGTEISADRTSVGPRWNKLAT